MAIIVAHPILFFRTQLSGILHSLLNTGDGYLARVVFSAPATEGPLGDIIRLAPAEYIRKWIINQPWAWLLFIFGILHTILLYSGSAYWLWDWIRARQFILTHIFCWGVLLYILIISAGPESAARFRVPLIPVLSVYCAAGLYLLVRRYFTKNQA